MSFSYLFDPNKQFQDRNGVNNVGGFLRVYIDGTDDRATTYKDFNGTLNEADIMLDTDGRAVVIVDDSLTFRIEVYERGGALQWTVTQFTARGEGGGGGSSTPVVVDGTANEIDVTESMTAGVKYYTIGLATVVKNTLLGLLASLSNLVGILNSKADKVQGATAGNLAAIDASGNLTDSGSKAADFKTKQTPVPDPSASGAGLDFIDSVTQNANGEITPHKKSVQDGTTAQKGVVQLQDSVGSTESSTDKAVTPHAVREAINAAVSSAYHAAGTKSVAQLTSSLLVAENEGCVYNITDSGTTTSDFVDGAGHPINAGDNVGVCDVGGGVYKFDLLSGFVDLTNYLTKTGDASNTTSTFTKASGDTSSMTSGGKLSAIFTAISSFFASLKALAFKDKISTGDISDDAITAAKVKDNETLPVNISGLSANATDWSGQISGTAFSVHTNRYVYIGRKRKSTYGCLIGMLTICSHTDSKDVYVISSGWSNGNFGDDATVQRISSGGTNASIKICLYNHEVTEDGITYSELWCYIPTTTTSGKADFAFRQLFNFKSTVKFPTGVVNRAESEFTGTLTKCANSDSRNIAFSPTNTAIGSTSVPVYVKASGEIDVCTDLSVTPDGTSTGYDLGSSTTLKAFAQKFKNLVSALKALAFKDKASYNDLSSGVQSSLNKADTALQSHQSVTDNNPTLAWGTTSKVGKVGSTDLRVTMPANPAQNLPASVITSGTFDKARIPTSLPNTTVKAAKNVNRITIGSSAIDLNNLNASDDSKISVYEWWLSNKNNVSNKPADNAGTLIVFGYDENNCCQICEILGSKMLFYRGRNADGWDAWARLVVASKEGVGSPTTPVYVDSNGQVRPCSQGSTLKSNTATLYIAGYTDNNIPYYHVKDIKNGCVNHVDFSGITNSTCNITFEAPTLSTGEEYDYIISLEGYNNNTGVSTGADVENCKQVLRYDYVNNLWIGEPLFLQATDWRQICVVRGNTCEWKRVALS